jgi:hypothetical protein
MHPLFSDAPIVPQSQVMPVMPSHSALAAALSGPRAPFTLPANGVNIPLSALAGLKGDPNASGVTSSTPNLAWNPNNPVGTETLGGNTANQGSWAGNAAAAYLPGYQGSPDQSATGAYQPASGDQALMNTMRQTGALAPQYQNSAAPPSWLDQIMSRIGGGQAPGQSGLIGALLQPPQTPQY